MTTGTNVKCDESVETCRELRKEPALRFDEGKVRLDLIPAEILVELGRVYTAGAKKYTDNNWKKGMSFSRCLGALKRHLAKWELGKTYDDETGCHELAHVMWNAAALLYYQMYGLGTDDRDIRGVVDDTLRVYLTTLDRRAPVKK